MCYWKYLNIGNSYYCCVYMFLLTCFDWSNLRHVNNKTKTSSQQLSSNEVQWACTPWRGHSSFGQVLACIWDRSR